ncbi:hypothetical protein WJX73_005827 [Symbiochloris irregularis]|uniref:Uncharacterized protein n=1 Tax=Symbiochloris irregularis TaxID=706552 RepID=A0AAW1NPY5_9CHLO
MPEPPWLQPLARVRDSELRASSSLGQGSGRSRELKLTFPEDRFLQSYLDRHPETRLQPVDLSSFRAPRARQFAWRQLDLVSAGLPRNRARELLEQHYKLPNSPKAVKQPDVLTAVQREEEQILLEAMERLRLAPSQEQ